MGTYRYISTSFWDDPWIRTLSPDERYLYLYFLTNTMTNISGVYQISLDRICFDSGYDSGKAMEIIKKFEKCGKAYFFQSAYIVLPKWPKHQKWQSRKKIEAGIKAILTELSPETLAFLKKIGYTYPIDSLSIPYAYPLNYSDSDLDIDIDIDLDLDINSCGSSEPPSPPIEPVEKIERLEATDSPPVETSASRGTPPAPKTKKPLLREREPENDHERVEKAYLENWDDLYSKDRVNTAYPVVNWGQARKLLSAHFAKGITPEKIIEALNDGLKNDFVMKGGYSLSTMLSASVLNGLLNSTGPPGRRHRIAGDDLSGDDWKKRFARDDLDESFAEGGWDEHGDGQSGD